MYTRHTYEHMRTIVHFTLCVCDSGTCLEDGMYVCTYLHRELVVGRKGLHAIGNG